MIETENLKLRQGYILAGIMALIAISTSLIAFSDDQSEIFWSNWTINATSAMSVGAGVLLLSKIRATGTEGRAHALLVAALSLWLAAELLWTYYELGLGIETPFPSAADALWLVGYGPFIYYVLRTYRLASSKMLEHKLISLFLTTIITSVIIAVFLFPIIDNVFSAGGHWAELLVGISYPVLDGVLLAISILTIASLRPGQQQYYFLPSVLIMVAMLAFVIADTGFGYGATTDMQVLEEQDRIWDSLYNVGYLCIAGALYWLYVLQKKGMN